MDEPTGTLLAFPVSEPDQLERARSMLRAMTTGVRCLERRIAEVEQEAARRNARQQARKRR